jgi:hypothetical protein
MNSPHGGYRTCRVSQWLAAVLLLVPSCGALRAEDPTAALDDTHLHWSDPANATTIEGKTYHGPWGNQTAALTLAQLPKHQWMRVRFDLYIVGSWDGSSPVWGPDLWSLTVRGAQRLIFSSFCAWGYAGNDEQSYPDDYPRAIHPAWTGVAKRDVLDIKDSDPPKNGVYQVEVLFPHTAEEAVLDFAGSYQDPPREQQRWGIGNVEVFLLPDDFVTDPSTLPDLWSDLVDADAMKANAAIWKMIGAGKAAVAFIKEQVERSPQGLELSDEENLRLQRAHRILRIIDGTGSLCFKIDQISLEYAKKYRSE